MRILTIPSANLKVSPTPAAVVMESKDSDPCTCHGLGYSSWPLGDDDRLSDATDDTPMGNDSRAVRTLTTTFYESLCQRPLYGHDVKINGTDQSIHQWPPPSQTSDRPHHRPNASFTSVNLSPSTCFVLQPNANLIEYRLPRTLPRRGPLGLSPETLGSLMDVEPMPSHRPCHPQSHHCQSANSRSPTSTQCKPPLGTISASYSSGSSSPEVTEIRKAPKTQLFTCDGFHTRGSHIVVGHGLCQKTLL